ncbi:MAG TPA: glycoside hydrolase family 2 TIM barrel-domain containing protein, partial [bacterium]|nr:glycoside hydrolase family 2 TIM barrel-domain containing protein [bacterium]
VHRPQIYTRDAIIETPMISENVWKLDLLLNTFNLGSEARGTFELTIRDPQGREIYNGIGSRQVLSGHTQYSYSMRMEDVQAWSPESPALYSLRIITSQEVQNRQHEKTLRFGFREIEVRGTQIYLNGEPLLIKGISRHEMYPGVGMTLTGEQMRADLEDIKSLGCNMIRTAHYAQHPRFYDLADEMGFLIWTEIPAWKTSVEVLTRWRVWEQSIKPQLEALVAEFRTHPSIVVWSVGNEFNSATDQGMTYVERATNYVRGLDPTRLVTFASDEHRPDNNDRSFQFVDIIAINEYYGWYYGAMNDIGPALDRLYETWPDKPILVAETGAGSLLSMHNSNPPDAGKDYSVEYQEKFLRTHLHQIFAENRSGFMAGALVWLYNDFPDPHRVGGGHPMQNNYVNSKGLVSQERQRKPAFQTVQEIFRSLSP